MWFLFSLSSGFFHAISGVFSKKALKEVNPLLVAFANIFFALPFFLIALLWLNWSPLNFIFWRAALISAALNVIALLFVMRALKIGGLSSTIPFLSFTPLFLIFTSKLIVGEFPSMLGILGIILIIVGAYVIETGEQKGFLGPFKSLVKNKGAQLVILASFIYSISSSFDKVAVLNSNPITYLVVLYSIIALVYIILIQLKSDQKFGAIKQKFKILFPIGLLAALTVFFQMTAINSAMVSYVISLKRTSVFWSVLLGLIIFKEKNIKFRLASALLMVIGVFLISLG